MEIKQLVEYAHENARQHGWHDNRRTFGELIALRHSGLSEALEEFRFGMEPNHSYYQNDGKPCMTCPKCGSHVVIMRRCRNGTEEWECLFCHNKWERK